MNRSTNPDLPYWDGYLDLVRREYNDYDHERFHSHYGCWDDPGLSNKVPADYGRAAERMCRKVCDAANIGSGSVVLDVGCGLGTVVASLNQRFSPIRLIGLNIDARQLAIARKGVTAQPGNRVEFIVGDGVALPVVDGSLDAVLALECTMHFPNRATFLSEVRRVLRPGGKLALCEHFAREGGAELPDRPKRSQIFGSFLEPISLEQFSRMANDCGLKLICAEDVSSETIPTFPMVRKILWRSMPNWKLKLGAWSTLVLAETLMRLGMLHYKVVAFEAR